MKQVLSGSCIVPMMLLWQWCWELLTCGRLSVFNKISSKMLVIRLIASLLSQSLLQSWFLRFTSTKKGFMVIMESTILKILVGKMFSIRWRFDITTNTKKFLFATTRKSVRSRHSRSGLTLGQLKILWVLVGLIQQHNSRNSSTICISEQLFLSFWA